MRSPEIYGIEERWGRPSMVTDRMRRESSFPESIDIEEEPDLMELGEKMVDSSGGLIRTP